MSAVRPLIVVSGFLGSGKTTLLRRTLADPAAAGTAVLVNELGAVGLDQEQYRHVAERAVVLANGCVCCATRADLADALRELIELEESGRAPRARRVVLETSGLADPAPIVSTVDRDPMLGARFAVQRIVVTCDAQHGPGHAAMAEWQAQVAAADVVAITKADLADPGPVARLVRRRNPVARVAGANDSEPLGLDDDHRERVAITTAADDAGHDHDHTTAISTSSVVLPGPVDAELVHVWLSALLHAHGPRLLRVKALLDTDPARGPLVLDAVQHAVYPPRHLPGWTGPRSSSLVVIARGLDATRVTRAFARVAAYSPGG